MSNQTAVAGRSILELMRLQSPKVSGNVVNSVRQAYSEKPKKRKPKK